MSRKEQTVSFTLRLPKSLWKQINHIAEQKRLSMAQAVVQAVEEYCKRETPVNVVVTHVPREVTHYTMVAETPKKGGRRS